MADQRKEQEEAEHRSSPTGSVVYKAIFAEGTHELERTTSALAWSGLAAGLSMGFCMVGQGLLRSHLPDTAWRPLIDSAGYSLGFLIVVLGRQQLFTENTLTVILPLLTERKMRMLRNVARLWTTVFLANLLGAFVFAFVAARTDVFSDAAGAAFLQLGHQAMQGTFSVTLLRGIYAGWLIAVMVWLLPFAESARVWVIIILTYIVGLAGFSHVIAGAVDVMYVASRNAAGWSDVFTGYIVPALIGNVIGGVSIVAAVNHAQVVAGRRTKAEDI